MASVLSAIKTQLITDVETTSIESCTVGVNPTSTTKPYAEITIGTGEYDTDVSSVLDRAIGVHIRVYGSEEEQVELALEELADLWKTPAMILTLNSLSVINMETIINYPPIVFAGRSSATPVIGDIQFRMTVRYSY